MECLSFCLGAQIDLQKLEQQIAAAPQFQSERFWGGTKLVNSEQPHHVCFIFANGTLITWQVKRFQCQEYIHFLAPTIHQRLDSPIYDEFSYKMATETSIKPHHYYDIDVLTIDDDSDNVKLSLSYGLSQSVKLQYFEQRLETLIDRYTPLTIELKSKGRLQIPRQKIRKIIGEIIEGKCQINLTSNFLYQPKFFWQHPTLEHYYHLIARYLDIAERTTNMNHRLDTLTEIFEMFNGYLENRHSHHLEIIIIVLIMLEIVFGILNLHF